MENNRIEIREVPGKGRGVFAARAIAKGEIIEQAPVIELPDPEWQELEKTALREYYFNWSPTSSAIALGCAELFNHSEQPNADTVRNVKARRMDFVALRDIVPGEEITIHYHCAPWFAVV